MPVDKLTVDEFMGRGLEEIRDPSELIWVFTTVVAAIPESVSKDCVLGMFNDAWVCGRGDCVEVVEVDQSPEEKDILANLEALLERVDGIEKRINGIPEEEVI